MNALTESEYNEATNRHQSISGIGNNSRLLGNMKEINVNMYSSLIEG